MSGFTKRPGFAREVSADLGPQIAYAEQRILSDFGDQVSVFEKAKSLLKFGKNIDIDTGTRETVWTGPDANETYVTTNIIDTISSSSASDTQNVVIEGHTVTGTGTNAQFTFVVQTATLNGQNKVVLSTPLARVSRAYDASTTPFAGDIYIYEDDTITGGVPNTSSKVHMNILGASGDTQSFKCATTFSNTDYFLCTGGWASINRSVTAVVDFRFEVRQVGGVFRPVSAISLTSDSGYADIFFNPYVIIPKNADVRVTAETGTNNTIVDASFQGYLAGIV